MDRLLPPDLSSRTPGLRPLSLGLWLDASPPYPRTIVTTILVLNTRELTTSAWLPFWISISEIILDVSLVPLDVTHRYHCEMAFQFLEDVICSRGLQSI